MNILYHLTIPPSPMSACDAVVQEVETLRDHFGGEISHLYPGRTPGTRFPRRWWGMHRLPYLHKAESQTTIHHIYNPDPYPFDVLRYLRRPIIYTIVAGAWSAAPATVQRLSQQVHTLVVSTKAESTRLCEWGIQNVTVVRPGIDVSRFSHTPPPSTTPPTLLMGSAPWTRAQFRTKGVDSLLELAQQVPDLRLIFLWRGVHVDEMTQRVQSAGLEKRVEILNEQVDVNAVLARVHAVVALAARDTLIKAYPHSLLEALAAGRPVLTSRSIPMAQYVEQTGSGLVVEQIDAASIKLALDTLLQNYHEYQNHAQNISKSDLALETLVQTYGRIYNTV